MEGSGAIRPCRDDERAAILAIVNAAAEAYRGVIPADLWHEPYMPADELAGEIAAGVEFWGYEADGALLGVMGIQHLPEVDLIRHAYVAPASQGRGVGGALLAHLLRNTQRRVLVGTVALPRPLLGNPRRRALVGTWAAARWAIRFYPRNGFELVSPACAAALLK